MRLRLEGHERLAHEKATVFKALESLQHLPYPVSTHRIAEIMVGGSREKGM